VGKLPVRLVEREDTALLEGLPDELRLAMTEVAVAAREGLLAMSAAVGLRVVGELLDAEVAATCGPKHAKQPDRSARRHGSTSGSLVLGGRRVPVDRPRARTLDGREVQLKTWQAGRRRPAGRAGHGADAGGTGDPPASAGRRAGRRGG
jgi:putative transposase